MLRGTSSRDELFDAMVSEDDPAKRERLTKDYVAALGADVEAERYRRARAPQMALRPDHEFPDEMDDIVVKDVTMFRAEAMDEHCWWMACYFANGERIAFWVNRGSKPARTVVSVTEMPAEWVDIDKERTSVAP